MKIPLASSGLREVDILAINRVLRSGNLTMGAQVKDFENQMARYLNVQHFVMVNSGSSANLAIFEALLRPAYNEPQLQVGDAVLVPAVAWPTTVWPILQLGLKPVLFFIPNLSSQRDGKGWSLTTSLLLLGANWFSFNSSNELQMVGDFFILVLSCVLLLATYARLTLKEIE